MKSLFEQLQEQIEPDLLKGRVLTLAMSPLDAFDLMIALQTGILSGATAFMPDKAQQALIQILFELGVQLARYPAALEISEQFMRDTVRLTTGYVRTDRVH